MEKITPKKFGILGDIALGLAYTLDFAFKVMFNKERYYMEIGYSDIEYGILINTPFYIMCKAVYNKNSELLYLSSPDMISRSYKAMVEQIKGDIDYNIMGILFVSIAAALFIEKVRGDIKNGIARRSNQRQAEQTR